MANFTGQHGIDVVYTDGTAGKVRNDVLDVLIATQKIIRFRRSDGWVDVLRRNARLRDYRNQEDYKGQEKRASWPDKV